MSESNRKTHHRNSFITLMENYQTAMKYAESAETSAGQGMQKFEAYTDSLTGKIEQFKNAFQSLSTTVANSDFLSGAVEIGTKIINVIDKMIDSFGTLNTVIAGFSLFKGAKGSGETSLQSQSFSKKKTYATEEFSSDVYELIYQSARTPIVKHRKMVCA